MPTIRHSGARLVRWDPYRRRNARSPARDARTARSIERAERPDLVRALDNGEGIWEATTLRGVDRALIDALDGYRRIGEPVAVFLADWPGGAREPADR